MFALRDIPTYSGVEVKNVKLTMLEQIGIRMGNIREWSDA